MDKNGALTVSGPFLDYFLNAFKYRQLMRDNDANDVTLPSILSSSPSKIDVDMVEDKLIEAFLALALKLPLDDFKPMFYRLFNLAVVSFIYKIERPMQTSAILKITPFALMSRGPDFKRFYFIL